MKTLTIYSASAGTGKTYTLATRYIALLMDNADDRAFRHVLAVTFTNKATAEMKQRILSYLYQISKG
ncbi:MAG: UvrD-helicase domain-containing protein, partial [Bacteroidaceae bacterium]|nr:UvrD-helicase domain-containing protein [Bacteroidaceae bacterium]